MKAIYPSLASVVPLPSYNEKALKNARPVLLLSDQRSWIDVVVSRSLPGR